MILLLCSKRTAKNRFKNNNFLVLKHNKIQNVCDDEEAL